MSRAPYKKNSCFMISTCCIDISDFLKPNRKARYITGADQQHGQQFLHTVFPERKHTESPLFDNGTTRRYQGRMAALKKRGSCHKESESVEQWSSSAAGGILIWTLHLFQPTIALPSSGATTITSIRRTSLNLYSSCACPTTQS